MKREGKQLLVSLDEQITVSIQKRQWSGLVVCQCITLILCVFSVLLTFELNLGMPLNRAICAGGMFFPVFFIAVYSLKESSKGRFVPFIIAGSFLLFLPVLFFYRDMLFQGGQIFAENLMRKVNQYYYTDFDFPHVYFPETDSDLRTTLLILCVIFLISFVGSYLLHRSKGLLFFAVLLAPVFWAAANLSVLPRTLPIILLLLSFMSTFALQIGVGVKRKRSDGLCSVTRGGKIHRYIGSDVTAVTARKSWVTVVSIVLVIVVATMLIFPRNSYQRNELLEKVARDPSVLIENLHLDTLFSTTANTGVGGGNLDVADRIQFKNKVHLKLTTQEKVPMLLKGYVGSVYEGNRWGTLPEPVYELNKHIFTGLEQYSVTPQTFSKPYVNVLNSHMTEIKEGTGINQNLILENQMTIENVAANKKYAYLPYFLKSDYFNSDFRYSDFITDTIVSGSNWKKRPYNVKASLFYTDVGAPYSASEGWLGSMELMLYEANLSEALLGHVADYSDFVYRNYLTLPETGLERMKDAAVMLQGVAETGVDPTVLVKEYLRENAVYDLAPGKLPAGKDYVEYFLYENHKGYCSHFATAATLMFRAMGIPARYVEGYTITQNEYLSPDSKGRFSIPDANAHAWTEIFMGPLGWVPVDVTPGFSNDAIAEPVENVPLPETMTSSEESVPSSSGEVSSEISSTENSSEETSSELSSEGNVSDIASSQVDESDSISSGGQLQEDEEIPREMSKGMLFLLTLVGTLLAIFLLILLKNSIVTAKRHKDMNQRNTNHAIISGYGYILRMLKFAGYEPAAGETEPAFALRVEQTCELIEGDGLSSVTALALAAGFSNHMLERRGLEETIAFAQSLNHRLYESLSLPQKLFYQLLYNLK